MRKLTTAQAKVIQRMQNHAASINGHQSYIAAGSESRSLAVLESLGMVEQREGDMGWWLFTPDAAPESMPESTPTPMPIGERDPVNTTAGNDDHGDLRTWRRTINGKHYSFNVVNMPDGELRLFVSVYNGYGDRDVQLFGMTQAEADERGMQWGCAWDRVHAITIKAPATDPRITPQTDMERRIVDGEWAECPGMDDESCAVRTDRIANSLQFDRWGKWHLVCCGPEDRSTLDPNYLKRVAAWDRFIGRAIAHDDPREAPATMTYEETKAAQLAYLRSIPGRTPTTCETYECNDVPTVVVTLGSGNARSETRHCDRHGFDLQESAFFLNIRSISPLVTPNPIPAVAKPPFTPADDSGNCSRHGFPRSGNGCPKCNDAESTPTPIDWTAERDQLRYDRQIWESGRRHAWCDHKGLNGARDCDHAIAIAPYDTYCQADGGQVGICTLSAMPPHADHLTIEGERFLQTPGQTAELLAIETAGASDTRAKVLATINAIDTRTLAAKLHSQGAGDWTAEHCHHVPPLAGCWCAILGTPIPVPTVTRDAPGLAPRCQGSRLSLCTAASTAYLACCGAPMCSHHAAETITEACPVCGSVMSAPLAAFDAAAEAQGSPAYRPILSGRDIRDESPITSTLTVDSRREPSGPRYGVSVEWWDDRAVRAVIGSYETWETAAREVERLKRLERFEFVHGIVALYASESDI